MRIAVLASSYPRFSGDGTAPFVQSIAETLVKFGHVVDVIAPYDKEVMPTDSKGLKIHRFKYSLIKSLHIMGHGRALESDVRLRPLAILLLPFYLSAAFIKLLQVTRLQKTEVIHVHWVLPNGPVAAMVAKIRRIPFIVSLHGSDMFLARKNRLYGFVAHWVFLQAANVTACSPELKNYALELGAPETTKLFAWGADPQLFRPSDNRIKLRHKLGWNDGVIIATLGRLVYKKGFDVLLKALPPVLSKYPNVKVIIGGNGPILDELQDLTRDLGISKSVQFIGRVPWNEVPDIFAAADIFVLPSVRDASGNLDGLPTVLLEAMGCGSAIIASDIGGVSLAIRNHENGLLVRPGSAGELTQALMKLVNDTVYCESLGLAARKTVVDDLNWDNVAHRIEKLLWVSISDRRNNLRMGSIYRYEMLTRSGYLEVSKGSVLDVGCHDGFLLKKLKADFRVGIDLQPITGVSEVSFVQADARYLPFRHGYFDNLYALDILEHIEDEGTFAQSLIDMLAKDGRLILTTPSVNIRLNPPFLTAWISKKWGHIYRMGYSPNKLIELFGKSLDVKVSTWNAPAYRFFYPFLRFLQRFLPRVVEKWVRKISHWDFNKQEGQQGFLIMVASPKRKHNKSRMDDPV